MDWRGPGHQPGGATDPAQARPAGRDKRRPPRGEHGRTLWDGALVPFTVGGSSRGRNPGAVCMHGRCQRHRLSSTTRKNAAWAGPAYCRRGHNDGPQSRYHGSFRLEQRPLVPPSCASVRNRAGCAFALSTTACREHVNAGDAADLACPLDMTENRRQAPDAPDSQGAQTGVEMQVKTSHHRQ